MRPSRPDLVDFDFKERPFTVAWELTRACALACRHCRAAATPKPHPDELSSQEAMRLVDQIADLKPVVLVLTGGDPFMRRDLFQIVGRAARQGMRVAVSPSATALATPERLTTLHDLGVSMVHISLDGAVAETHDAFRGFAGTFVRSLELLRVLQSIGLPVQVGTTLTKQNATELPAIAGLIGMYGVRVWNVFYLVPTGRGQAADMVDVETAETSWRWLARLSGTAKYTVRTTAAPQFRRVQIQALAESGVAPPRLAGAGYAVRPTRGGLQMRGVNDGKGFLFIDRVGGVCPSGFLQLPAGNVREQDPGAIYRDAPLFQELRDPAALTGRCGRCRFAELCGGSRARAYATSGSYLADDPLCAYADSVAQAS